MKNNENYLNVSRYSRRCNTNELNNFIKLLTELGIKSGEGYFIRPEQLTDGKGVKAACNGLTFYIYLNSKGAKKIASNKFNTIEDARKILRKITKLCYCYLIIDKDKFESHQMLNNIYEDNNKKNYLSYLQNVMVISSDICGLGKSEKIKAMMITILEKEKINYL